MLCIQEVTGAALAPEGAVLAAGKWHTMRSEVLRRLVLPVLQRVSLPAPTSDGAGLAADVVKAQIAVNGNGHLGGMQAA